MRVMPERRRYILAGNDDNGGGHRYGTARPFKSEFPADWTDDRVIQAIEEVANDVNSIQELAAGGRIFVRGERHGLSITVIIGRDGSFIITGYPTNSPRNPSGGTSGQ